MEVKEVLIRSLNESWKYLTKVTDGLTQEEIGLLGSTWSTSAPPAQRGETEGGLGANQSNA